MKLYTHPVCPFVHRVRLGLAVRQISAAQISCEDISFDSPPASLLAINPKGSVPTLEIEPGNGFAESAIVLEFLDSIDAPGPHLYGKNPADRAKTKAVIEVLQSDVLSVFMPLLYSRANALTLERQSKKLDKAYDVLELELSKKEGPFLGGESLNAADCMLFPFVSRLALLSQKQKRVFLPMEGTLARSYVDACRHHPLLEQIGASASNIESLVTKYLEPGAEVMDIQKASRQLVENLEEQLQKMNDQIKKDFANSPTEPALWKKGSTQKGSHIEATIKLAGYEHALFALNELIRIQETANHHTDFKLNNTQELMLQLCTHEPKWGVTEKDLVMAQTLSRVLSKPV